MRNDERRRRGAAALLAATAVIASLAIDAAVPVAAAARVGSEEFPAKCEGPPIEMRLEGGADSGAGDAEFEVTAAVARRVPILTGREQPGRTRKELEDLERRAAKTRLALYQIVLADFGIHRRQLTGEFSGAFPVIDPKPGKTAGIVSLVPVRARGFERGDVVRADNDLRYETVTTFGTLGLSVITADTEFGTGVVSGRAKILGIDDDHICIDVDIEISDIDANTLVAAVDGIVTAAVVRAPRDVYFF